MDNKDFQLIKNKELNNKPQKKSAQTNPIVKKFAGFCKENQNKFSVKDLFKS